VSGTFNLRAQGGTLISTMTVSHAANSASVRLRALIKPSTITVTILLLVLTLATFVYQWRRRARANPGVPKETGKLAESYQRRSAERLDKHHARNHGAGVSMCPGRFFAKQEIAITFA
jgi:hypothetical protein